MSPSDGRRGLILFGHGARDERWAEPFTRLQERVAGRRPGMSVALAYLEIMSPDLATAADALVAEGCVHLTVVPIFLGQGAHLRRDLPLLVEALRSRMPSIAITVAEAAGEDDTVLDAIAAYCVRLAT